MLLDKLERACDALEPYPEEGSGQDGAQPAAVRLAVARPDQAVRIVDEAGANAEYLQGAGEHADDVEILWDMSENPHAGPSPP